MNLLEVIHLGLNRWQYAVFWRYAVDDFHQLDDWVHRSRYRISSHRHHDGKE